MNLRIKKTQVKHFTISEETRFRRAVGEGSNPRDNLIFDILFDTGLRLGELTALNVGDVSGKDYLTVVGKGRKERTIPIGAVEGLKGKIESFQEWKRSHGEDTHPRSPLFCSKPGNRRITDRAVQYMVNRYAKKAGLERKFHPHACRHTFGFKLGKKGVPIQVIKKLMGHSKIETTSIYVDPDMDQLENALNSLFQEFSYAARNSSLGIPAWFRIVRKVELLRLGWLGIVRGVVVPSWLSRCIAIWLPSLTGWNPSA